MTRPSTISIVIPCYNGADKISVLLNALTKQTVLPNEIIVVSDGSSDKTVAVTKTFKELFRNLRVIEISNRGRSAARNTGVRNSKGDIIIFYDDDMEPKEKSIEQHLQFHMQNNGLVCGLPLEVVSPKQTDILNYKAIRAAGWLSAYSNALNKLELEKLFFTTSNCSITCNAFNLLKGFDERLTDAEDFDLAYRAIELGISVFFDRTNIAIHHERITCKSYITRKQQYEKSHDKLRLLHPNRVNPGKPIRPSSTKRFIYSIFGLSIWIWIIDNTNLLTVIPQFWRYKIYDWVIHSHGIVNTSSIRE